MTFAAFPLAVFAAGALALAALLFVLQRLRVRERIVSLPAARLWLEAAGATPPDMFWERFRRWAAYLFMLVIALTIWFAAARPETTPSPTDRTHLFYLDASAFMTAGGNFGSAKDRLLADLATIPSNRRAVYLGDAWSTPLLMPGENVALLAKRLAGVAPGAYPSSFPAWLRNRASSGGGPIAVHYYGYWSAAAAAARTRPATVELVLGSIAPALAANRGIVGLGVTPAASGAWDKADVLVAVAGTQGAPATTAADLRIDGDGPSPAADALRPMGGGRFVLRDLPARGQELRVALRRGDGFAADDSATIRVPDRHRIRVWLGPALPAAIRAAVQADSAIELSSADRAEVLIRLDRETAPSDRPALVVDTGFRGPAFAFGYPARDGGLDLPRQIDQLGLSDLDAAALADRLNRPIATEAAVASHRTVTIWSAVLADRGFAGSRVLPLFVSNSVRWLADRGPWIPYAQAGRTLLDQTALYDLADDGATVEQALNDGIFIPGDGAATVGGNRFPAALIDRAQTLGVAAPPPASLPRRDGGWPVPDLPFALLPLIAGLLLVVEWRLFQRRAIP